MVMSPPALVPRLQEERRKAEAEAKRKAQEAEAQRRAEAKAGDQTSEGIY